jgi:hypothetical protein
MKSMSKWIVYRYEMEEKVVDLRGLIVQKFTLTTKNTVGLPTISALMMGNACKAFQQFRNSNL